MPTTYRIAGVRVSRELEQEARDHSGLGQIPLGALVRISIGVLAGYPLEESITKFWLDPSSKRFQDFEAALNGQSQKEGHQ
jgi:hypothetical protein